MASQIFISQDLETVVSFVHWCFFAISAFFNAIATLCLYRQAPEMQSELVVYLYAMQAIVLLTDLNLEVLVQPFFLLPVLGGYCKGILCEWIHVRYSLLLSFLNAGAIAFCIFSCFWCRHQTIVTGRFKFSLVGNRAARVIVLVILASAFIYAFQTNFDESQSEQLIDLHGLEWIRERGPHVIIKRTPNVTQFIPLGFFVIITFAIVFGVGIVAHTWWHIYHGTKRSATSMKRISRAMLILVVQLCLPLALVGLPNTLFVFCFMDDTESIPFGKRQVSFLINRSPQSRPVLQHDILR